MATYAVGADVSTHAVHLALVGSEAVEITRVIDLQQHPIRWLGETKAFLTSLRERHWYVEPWPLALYLEAPWARAEKGIQTALEIHRIAAFVEAAAWFAGLQVERVAIPTWKTAIFGRNLPSAQSKRAAIEYVRRVFGVETRDNNLADAIAIGAYGQRQQQLTKRLAEARA